MKKPVVVVQVSVLFFWLMSCARLSPKENALLEPTSSPPVSWNSDANSRVLLATFSCDGPIVQELVRPYIPEAQIWGDGRFLWSVQAADGARQVFVKQLSTNEMAELLQEITDSGLFNWDEEHKSEPVVDAASQCLTVTLTDQNKMVCATHGGGPDAFHALHTWLAEGAGTNDTLYWPDRAYLTGFQLEDANVPRPQPDLAWPETLAHIPIATAVNGLWLDDEETLRLIWEAANRNPYHMPVVEDGDISYRLILQVPGVSWIEP